MPAFRAEQVRNSTNRRVGFSGRQLGGLDSCPSARRIVKVTRSSFGHALQSFSSPHDDIPWPSRDHRRSAGGTAPAPARGGWPGPPPGPLRIGPSKPMRRRRSARRTLQAAIWHRPSAMYRSVDRLPRSGPDGLQHKGPRCHAASQPAAIRPSASTTTNRMERYARRPPGRPVMPLATASRSKGRYFTRRRALVNPPGAPGFVGIAICPGYFASYWHAGATDLGPAQEGPSCTNSGP